MKYGILNNWPAIPILIGLYFFIFKRKVITLILICYIKSYIISSNVSFVISKEKSISLCIPSTLINAFEFILSVFLAFYISSNNHILFLPITFNLILFCFLNSFLQNSNNLLFISLPPKKGIFSTHLSENFFLENSDK
jgi:hypothetical protein